MLQPNALDGLRCCFVLAVLCAASVIGPLHADIYRWDNGQVIPGTTGIEPGPGLNLMEVAIPYADLAGVELSGSYFGDVSRARFTGANLSYASFPASPMQFADLSGANLTGTSFDASYLGGADFTDAYLDSTQFRTSTLRGFTKEQLYSTASYKSGVLHNLSFVEGSVSAWDFSNQDLTQSHFDYAQMHGTNFSGATIAGATFNNATQGGFTKEQLYSTASYQAGELDWIWLGSNNMTGWNFAGKTMRNAIVTTSTLNGADFRGANVEQADLSGSKFIGADLRQANFSSADLNGADLTNADVSDAILLGARLDGAKAPGANFTGADLSQVRIDYHFTDANFTGVKMEQAQIHAKLVNVNFGGADLTDADFNGSEFQNVNIADANVTRANFGFTTFRGFTKEMLYSTQNYQERELSGMDLSSNALTGWNFADQRMVGVNLGGATIANADFQRADLSASNFGGANITSADLRDALLRDAFIGNATKRGFTAQMLYDSASYQNRELGAISFNEGNVQNWDFSQQSMAGAAFVNADLAGATFTQANLHGANFNQSRGADAHFSHAVVSNASITSAQFPGANFSDASLVDANLSAVNLIGAHFDRANLQGAEFDYTNLTDASFDGADIRGALFVRTLGAGFTSEQLYSTASYRTRDLRGVRFFMDMSGWDLSGQDLRESTLQGNFHGGNLVGADLRNSNFELDLTNAVIHQANFGGVTSPYLGGFIYSSLSYQTGDLRGIGLSGVKLENWNLQNKNLTGADFSDANLKNTRLAGSQVQGASFAGTVGTGFTPQQLYATASYAAQDLTGVDFSRNALAGWDFTGKRLVNTVFTAANLSTTTLTGADLRGATGVVLSGNTSENVILPDGVVEGLEVLGGSRFVVRNDVGDLTETRPRDPLSVLVNTSATIAAGGVLAVRFDASDWNSTIQFEPQIPVTLQGILQLGFEPDVDLASQIGRTFQVFDWNGVAPTGKLSLFSPSYAWDFSGLWDTGIVTYLGSLTGNTNGDDRVDLADLNNVRNQFGQSGQGMAGDVSGDAVVDLADLNAVRNAFGQTVAPTPTPEPASVVLLILTVALACMSRLRRTSKHG